MDIFIKISVFFIGFVIVALTISSALSTFVLPRAARSQLNRIVFGIMRRIFEFILKFVRTYERRDAIMAYYSPISLIMLVPVWYTLILAGYTAMYWSLGVGDLVADFRLSGSSLLTLGFCHLRYYPCKRFLFFRSSYRTFAGRFADGLFANDVCRFFAP